MRQTYSGIIDPARRLEELRPLREKVILLMQECRPFSEQYCALDKVKAAIDECAAYFTKDRTFFHRKPPVGNGC